MKTQYLKHCSRCDKTTLHEVYHISRKRGVKLKCLVCGNFNQRYFNLNFLEEHSATTKEELNDWNIERKIKNKKKFHPDIPIIIDISDKGETNDK